MRRTRCSRRTRDISSAADIIPAAWVGASGNLPRRWAEQLQRRLERRGGGHLGVRLDTDALPVRLRDRIDRPRERDADHEVIVDAPAAHGMRAAPRRLADDGCALEHLEVVGELLAAREGVARGEDEHRLLAAEAPAGHAVA